MALTGRAPIFGRPTAELGRSWTSRSAPCIRWKSPPPIMYDELIARYADNPALRLRYSRTLAFLQSRLSVPCRILDLGAANPFGEILKEIGFEVSNTSPDVDLDLVPEAVRAFDVEVVTAFEIFEHLVAPFNLLRHLPANRLIATVPLRLWFDGAYRNPSDPWDRHFHEFEDWQFDWLLEKAEWTVEHRMKWNGPAFRYGIRPLLRLVTPRYYGVDAVRVR